MTQILKLFLDICLFRKGPQDVPADSLLFGLTVAAYGTIGMALLGLEVSVFSAAYQVMLEGIILLGFVYFTLASAQLNSRFQQTSIAMMGSDALISSLAIPILAFNLGAPNEQAARIVLLMLMLWHVSVVAHILRHALSRSYSSGLALAIAYVVLTLQLMTALVGPNG